jgi:uncharacterized protein YmfQ (DUF2313 family)
MTTPDDKHYRRSGADYATAFLNLFPQGLAWPRQVTSVLVELVTGLAQRFGYADGRAADLLEIESDPRKTVELLLDWERNFGLPEVCSPQPITDVALRQTVLVTKMTMRGGQSRAFFLAQALALGEVATIREYSPYQCGISRVGDTRYLDDGTHFRWGLGPAEIRYHWVAAITHVLSGVECVFNRFRPMHTELTFTYSSVLDRSMSSYYFLGI